MRRRLALLGSMALLAALAGVAACRVPIPFGTDLFFAGGPRALPSAHDCERCHQEIYREWRDSRHAHAFTSDVYRRATHGGTDAPCAGCHAPAPLVADSLPQPRLEHRDEGITCATCHMATGKGVAPLTMRGPVSRSSPVEVHPVIVADAAYRTSALCGGCHRAAYREWQATAATAPDTETCQGCHMPSVHRKVESVNDRLPYSAVLVALEKSEKLRRHRFAVPDDAGKHLELKLVRRGDVIEATVHNELPHALPTGRFGRREVRLHLAWPGGGLDEKLGAQPADPLGAGQSRTIRLRLPPQARGAELSVSLQRFDHAEHGFVKLVGQELPAGR